MTTELITFKLDSKFLKEVDKFVQEHGFHSRTEFLRDALRTRMQDIKFKQQLEQISKLKGIYKNHKITEEDYERAREAAFEGISKKFK